MTMSSTPTYPTPGEITDPLLVIAFAGSSRAQGEEDRNLQAEDVFHSFLSAFTDSDVDGIVNLFSEDAPHQHGTFFTRWYLEDCTVP
jgi:hypothetical protein